MRKIKLKILIDVLEDIKGGAERQVYELLKYISRKKFEVELLVLHQREVCEFASWRVCELASLRVGEFNEFTSWRVSALGIKRIYSIKGIIEGLRFAKFLKKERPDILMTYHFGSDIWGTVFGRIAGVPLIISNRRDVGFWRKKIHILAYRLINRWVDKIVVVSKAVRNAVLKEERAPEEKIEVIYNGVDIERFKVKIDTEQIKRDLKIPQEAKIIGSVGNLRPIKGHKFLIKAAQRVISHYPEAHFLIIGEGDLRNSLETLSKDLGINSNIHFLGKRDDVPELLSIMDVCVLPSLSEGLSNTLLEYMAAQKPIIATNVGGNPEVIEDGKNGILIPPQDPIALAEQIIRLFKNPKLSWQLASSAKQTVTERFNLNAQIHLLEDFLLRSTRKEIRVAHLISSNGIFGAEKVVLSLASGMNYNGIKPYVIAIKNLYNPHLEIIEEATRLNLMAESIDCAGKIDLKTVSRLSDFLRKNRINLIHSHNYKANFVAALVSRRNKIPFIATNHLWTKANFKLKFYEAIDAFILKYFAKKVIAVSDEIKKDLLKAGVPIRKITVIPNGIEIKKDTSLQQDIKSKFGIQNGAIIIGVIARLSPEKGHIFLFEALREVIKSFPNVVLLVIGDGDLRRNLEEKVCELGLDKNVIFTGYQRNMQEIYPALDIVVQPSLREGIPITILEAMSYGKAIVATDVGGVGNLIHNKETGLLVSPGLSQGIKEAIEALCADTQLRKQLGENARRFVCENYSLENMANSYRRIYEQVLSE